MRPTRLWRRFADHPASVGETYVQHLSAAAALGADLLLAGLACLAHAIFPFLFVRTGSNAVKRLHRTMNERLIGETDEHGGDANASLPDGAPRPDTR